mgnify:CR=1 FL=1
MDKAEVREHARRLHLAIANKPDSQDICFVPTGDYAGLVKKLRPETAMPGDIVDLNGRTLGRNPKHIDWWSGRVKHWASPASPCRR